MLRTVAEHVDVADTETVSSRCPRIASVAYQRTHEQQTNRKHEPRSVLVFFSILQIMDLVLQVAKVGAAIKSKARLFGDLMPSWVVASPSNTARGHN